MRSDDRCDLRSQAAFAHVAFSCGARAARMCESFVRHVCRRDRACRDSACSRGDRNKKLTSFDDLGFGRIFDRGHAVRRIFAIAPLRRTSLSACFGLCISACLRRDMRGKKETYHAQDHAFLRGERHLDRRGAKRERTGVLGQRQYFALSRVYAGDSLGRQSFRNTRRREGRRCDLRFECVRQPGKSRIFSRPSQSIGRRRNQDIR